ncbi:unnamed protein product [Parnassius apollo]|uniref:(apollo) hypothetical protein n=1 Tax=Parnassius apollo TaxID=110799 RepID=A0A8S3XWT3_PARAO|nr:unnamed protein product [Parnassius apollo]
MSFAEEIPKIDTDKMQAEEIKSLRGSIKGRITKFGGYVQLLIQYEVENIFQVQFKELTLRLVKIKNLFYDSDTVKTKLELLSDEHLPERDAVENQFYSTVS